MTTHPKTLALDNQLCFAFYSVSHAFNRAYRKLLEPLGLTYPQYVVLLVLWEQDELTVKEIGERLFLDSGTLTPLLKRLESAGHVRRTRDTKDERQVRIHLTESGRVLRGKAEEVPHQVGCMLGMSADEARALTREVAKLRGRLHDSATLSPDT
ncbi:MarR family winged helix-turn-helix transcriptional regulator [Microvirga lotononidis]|uniref:Transcriptional regulator n=1 Tax=Microvirga lotononidis TaxID=864069 RepID=I4YPN9_9HYPH|nr:MarR family transcriptional regulator [Microvirga lotononidis]EIM25931.1 transcriptional regulator [Microvirga lotononidis]WQO25845.1 MarR family transcriptional regulator [Microvirga lotononidis]